MASETTPLVPMPAEAAPAEKSSRVFIRGFDFGTTEEQVKVHCAGAGQVVSCEKQSNNAMILTYSSPEEAEKAAATFNQTVIEGNTRYIDVKLDEGKETGKDKKPKEAGPSGPDLPRQRVTESPITGSVLRFVGNTGWIKPADTFEHPELGRHKGKIYVHKKDLQGVESLLKDTSIACHLYLDGAGLGAEEVTVVALPPAEAQKPKGPPPESPPPAAPGTVSEGAEAKTGEGKEGAEAQAKSSSKKKKKKKNKGKGKNSWGWNGGWKSWKAPSGPNGPDLSRTRIGESPISGSVLRFVGASGWIKPSENVDHPEFNKHKGKIYVHKKDLQGLESLEKDMNVVFHLYADAAGLGAEEVTLAL